MPETELLELNEIIESTDELIEELNEEISVLELIEITEPEPQVSRPQFSIMRYYRLIVLAAIALSLILSITALITAINSSNTVYISEDGQVTTIGGNTQKRFENSIKSELSGKIPNDIRVKDIVITVELNGRDLSRYKRLTDLEEGDRIIVSVEFIPQRSVAQFAKDCRAVLDIMEAQGIEYDDITFFSEGAYTKMRVDFNGKFRMDITEEELISLTYYFGEIEDDDEDLPDISP
ncbi:MAG: hypothetical protein FWD34_09705 [Oscillospiraceae bacterium]|nr:hypothetical protein [Oscillospiraceae bacterium]